MREKIRETIIPIITILVSIALGIIFEDYIVGTLSLICAFLNAYYMAIGKWYNYIWGILFSILYMYSCFVNGLYGLVIFTILFFIPIQVSGIISWLKNKESDDTVSTRSLNLKSSTILCTIVIIGSFLVGYLLTLIPTQNLAWLDSSSQILNLAGVVLGSMRYREAWYIWLANNVADLSIWIINTILSTPNAYMMLVVSIMYLIMNIIGITSWIKLEKKQKDIIG